MKKWIASACLCLTFTCSASAASREDLQDRIDAAKQVLDQVMAAGDRSIPMNILEQATCVGVVPGLIKGAFVFGAQYGQGVVTCRTGHGWSAPVFIRMAGGSWGLQIGGDAAASAGPVGRNGQAATDWKMSAELLTYSRSKGLFAGIDLDGTVVSQNTDDTQIFYGRSIPFDVILKGSVEVPQGAVPFVKDVAHYFVEAKHR